MPLRLKSFFDPKHNEWLYDIFSNLNAEQKALLNNREQRLLRNKGQLKKFIATGDYDKIHILLTKLGIQWSTVYYVPDLFDPELIKKAYRQYSMKGKSVKMLDEMLRQKVFVLNDKDVATSLAMMSMTCHSSAWVCNMEFIKIRQTTNEAMANISKGMSEKNMNAQFNQAYNGMKVIARLSNQIMLISSFLGNLDLMPLDYIMMNYLFFHQNNYINIETIKQEFRSEYKPMSIGLRMVFLWKKGYVDKMPAEERERRFRITASGILVLGQIYNYIVNHAANF